MDVNINSIFQYENLNFNENTSHVLNRSLDDEIKSFENETRAVDKEAEPYISCHKKKFWLNEFHSIDSPFVRCKETREDGNRKIFKFCLREHTNECVKRAARKIEDFFKQHIYYSKIFSYETEEQLEEQILAKPYLIFNGLAVCLSEKLGDPLREFNDKYFSEALIRSPVRCSQGHYFERESARLWKLGKGDVCPDTSQGEHSIGNLDIDRDLKKEIRKQRKKIDKLKKEIKEVKSTIKANLKHLDNKQEQISKAKMAWKILSYESLLGMVVAMKTIFAISVVFGPTTGATLGLIICVSLATVVNNSSSPWQALSNKINVFLFGKVKKLRMKELPKENEVIIKFDNLSSSFFGRLRKQSSKTVGRLYLNIAGKQLSYPFNSRERSPIMPKDLKEIVKEIKESIEKEPSSINLDSLAKGFIIHERQCHLFDETTEKIFFESLRKLQNQLLEFEEKN